MPLNPHLRQKTIKHESHWAWGRVALPLVGAIVAGLLCAAITPEATDMAWRCSGRSNNELVTNLFRSMHALIEVVLWCHFADVM